MFWKILGFGVGAGLAVGIGIGVVTSICSNKKVSRAKATVKKIVKPRNSSKSKSKKAKVKTVLA